MALSGDHLQVLVGGYELTGDYNRILINDRRDLYDVTAFNDAGHYFVPGKRNIGMDHFGFLNNAAARSHPVLKGININGVLSVLLGQNAAPAVGDPVYSLTMRQSTYGSVPEVGKQVPFSARFNNKGEKSGWGVALTPPVSFTNTTTGSGVDNGASSANGGAAFLHVLQAAASDTYTIIVEHATQSNFSDAATLATFTLNASQLGSERIAIAGTINRYTRFKATRTGAAGNTVKIAVALVRF